MDGELKEYLRLDIHALDPGLQQYESRQSGAPAQDANSGTERPCDPMELMQLGSFGRLLAMTVRVRFLKRQ